MKGDAKMNESLRKLRLAAKMTQEDLAEKMNVSRQSVAKWESGESVPDITKCNELAKIFDLEINDIANLFIPQTENKTLRPKNKYVFGVSKIINNKIIIPDEAMTIFNIKNGDELIILGDTTQGIALIPKKDYEEFFDMINNFQPLGDE